MGSGKIADEVGCFRGRAPHGLRRRGGDDRLPVVIDAMGVSLARRPRLYWVDWELQTADDAVAYTDEWGRPGLNLRGAPVEAGFFFAWLVQGL